MLHQGEDMKVKRTKNGNIKIVMSEVAAWLFRDVIGRVSIRDMEEKYSTPARWRAAECTWNKLDNLLREGNK